MCRTASRSRRFGAVRARYALEYGDARTEVDRRGYRLEPVPSASGCRPSGRTARSQRRGTVTDDLESRVRRLEDRALISEVVTRYAIAVDRRDWTMLADCFTDPVHADYSENGLAAADFVRDELVAIVRDAVSGYTATQHLSPNHVIAFDDDDPDRAICTSYMYAQHHVDTSEKSAFLLLRGSYSNHMVRTADRWRIERLIQHIGWREACER
jgi:SnoaL-like domain